MISLHVHQTGKNAGEDTENLGRLRVAGGDANRVADAGKVNMPGVCDPVTVLGGLNPKERETYIAQKPIQNCPINISS